tara:strand:+ start:40 stop:411 length:372 start_codon:yes stop_codon:yes gene_type:complete
MYVKSGHYLPETLLTPSSASSYEVVFLRIEKKMWKDHKGIQIITKTPLYTVDWYIKWVSSIILMLSTVLTANNIFPLNLYFHSIGIGGWLIVGMLWNDRALMVINAFALATLLTSLFRIHLTM